MNRGEINSGFNEPSGDSDGGFGELEELADQMGNWDNLDEDDFEIYDGSGWSEVGFDDSDNAAYDTARTMSGGSILKDKTMDDDDFIDLGVLNTTSERQDHEEQVVEENDEAKIKKKIAEDRELIQGIIQELGDNANEVKIVDAIIEKFNTSRFRLMTLSDEVVDEFGLRETIGQCALKMFGARELCLEYGKDFLDKYGIRNQVVSAFLNTFDNILDKTTIPKDAIEHFYDDDREKDLVIRYMHANHPIENFGRFCHGIEENILPNLDSDEELYGLGDDHADLFGDSYGVDDYKIKCLTESCTPRTFNELMLIEMTLPTSDFSKRAQNRADALVIEGKVIGDHSFIHEERPGVHLIMKTMMEFYDACKEGDEEKRGAKRAELSKLDQEYKYGFYPNAACIVKDSMEDVVKIYEQKAGVSRRERSVESSDEDTCIDVVRRLAKNTAPVLVRPPKTKSRMLNEAMKKISPLFNENTGEIRVEIGDLADSFIEMNQVLQERQTNLGIMPSFVSAAVFLEKMAKTAIDSLSARKLKDIIFDSTFKEIVRFSQLTASTEYDKNKFEAFYAGMQQQIGQAYAKDDDIEIKNGYALLQQHILQNLRNLSSHYGSRRATMKYGEGIMGQDTLEWSLIKIVDEI